MDIEEVSNMYIDTSNESDIPFSSHFKSPLPHEHTVHHHTSEYRYNYFFR